jgi:hypothetical protein
MTSNFSYQFRRSYRARSLDHSHPHAENVDGRPPSDPNETRTAGPPTRALFHLLRWCKRRRQEYQLE